jgi:hypothetical protein
LPKKDVPSPSAISKALDRHGPEARKGIQLKFKVTKKVREENQSEEDNKKSTEAKKIMRR